MCYPKPGPRCSKHATDDLRRVEEHLQEAEQRLNDLHVNPSSAEEREAAVEDLQKLRGMREERYYRWLQTPQGLEFLREKADSEEGAAREETLSLHKRMSGVREASLQAFNVLKTVNSRVETASPEQQRKLEGLWEEREKSLETYKQLEAQISYAEKGLVSLEDTLKARKAAARSLLQEAKNEGDKLSTRIRNTYERHGIPRELANHYTVDTLNDLQDGYTYSAALQERFPTLKEGTTERDTLKFKTKGGSSATFAAAEELTHSSDVQEQLSEIYLKNQIYNSSVDTVSNVERQYLQQRAALNELRQLEPQYRKQAVTASREYNQYHGAVSSGIVNEKVYVVNSQNFLGSAYRSRDGESNAYILSTPQFGDKQLPVYSRVVRFWKDKTGAPCVETDLGERYRGKDLDRLSLALTTPKKDWRRVFR